MSDRAPAYSPMWTDDTRADPDPLADERGSLTSLLDWQRQTFELKCSGLTAEQMSRREIPPSGMTLHGLLRHLAGTERWWFQQNLAGADVPHLHYVDADPNSDFDDLSGDVGEAFAIWHRECETSRAIVSAASLDQVAAVVSERRGQVSLRWILLHMIAEYARHNGHADLLRERIDGRTGE